MPQELFNQQSPPPGAAAQGPPPGPVAGQTMPTGVMPGAPEFNEEEPSPEEQGQYEQFVTKAIGFMAKNKMELVASMNNNQKPVHENVGELAVKIGKGIHGMASSAGEELGMDVIQAAGAEIIEHLMEMGTAAKIFPFDEESDQYDQEQSMALLHAEKVVGDELINSPKYTPEMQEEAQNFYAQQVAGEVQRGEVPEGFHENLGNQVAGGVRKAIQGG